MSENYESVRQSDVFFVRVVRRWKKKNLQSVFQTRNASDFFISRSLKKKKTLQQNGFARISYVTAQIKMCLRRSLSTVFFITIILSSSEKNSLCTFQILRLLYARTRTRAENSLPGFRGAIPFRFKTNCLSDTKRSLSLMLTNGDVFLLLYRESCRL